MAIENENGKTWRSNQFYRNCLTRFGDIGENPAMVLDDHGKVLFCTPKAENILGCEMDGLLNRSIQDWVPSAPLNIHAPGSNIVNASYAGRQNQWQEYQVFQDSGKNTFALELLFDVMQVDLRYLILLWMRTPAARFLRGNGAGHGIAGAPTGVARFLREAVEMAEKPDPR